MYIVIFVVEYRRQFLHQSVRHVWRSSEVSVHVEQEMLEIKEYEYESLEAMCSNLKSMRERHSFF